MRRVNGDMMNSNNVLETVNAAANAIGLAEARAPPTRYQKRRWGSCLSAYWCFGHQKEKKRIGRAVLVPEPTSRMTEAPSARDMVPPVSLPFAAPPSSPASFVLSEPPSAAQSPAGVSLTSIAANMYSPDGPRSIFAIGPYAHETQLVSPPTFSTYTTEPSTAAFTPPESVHMTTPSSPEVPFAQFLDPSPHGGFGQMFMQAQYDYQPYQFYTGSPAGQLISPSSVISGSGTSSPLLDQDLFAGGFYYPDVQFGVPPRLLNLQFPPASDWGSGRDSGSLTPDGGLPKTHDGFNFDHQNTTISPFPIITNEHQDQEGVISQRVSFELNTEDVVRCVEKGSTVLPKVLQAIANGNRNEEKSISVIGDETIQEDAMEKPQVAAEVEEGQRSQRQRSASLGSIKEFIFDNTGKGESHKPCLGPNWWTNDTLSGKEGEQAGKNWSFFPVAQPSAT